MFAHVAHIEVEYREEGSGDGFDIDGHRPCRPDRARIRRIPPIKPQVDRGFRALPSVSASLLGMSVVALDLRSDTFTAAHVRTVTPCSTTG
jgi:hypothetical protein